MGIAYDSSKGEVFVPNYFEDMVSVISDATNTVIGTIAVGSESGGTAYDPAQGEVFVADANSSTVSVISDAADIVVATVP